MADLEAAVADAALQDRPLAGGQDVGPVGQGLEEVQVGDPEQPRQRVAVLRQLPSGQAREVLIMDLQNKLAHMAMVV